MYLVKALICAFTISLVSTAVDGLFGYNPMKCRRYDGGCDDVRTASVVAYVRIIHRGPCDGQNGNRLTCTYSAEYIDIYANEDTNKKITYDLPRGRFFFRETDDKIEQKFPDHENYVMTFSAGPNDEILKAECYCVAEKCLPELKKRANCLPAPILPDGVSVLNPLVPFHK